MNRRTRERIVADIREEFDELREKLSRHLEPDTDVDQTRRMLVEHAPAMVVAKTQLLLDTLLNYLMADAAEALTDASTTVKNAFYNLDLRARIKKSFSLKPELLELSFDPRIIVGGITAGLGATAGGLMTALFLSGLISRIVGGLATIVASAIAFRLAHTAATGTALQRLRKDLDKYLNDSKQQVSSWLTDIEEDFVAAFKEFQDEVERSNGGKSDGSEPS